MTLQVIVQSVWSTISAAKVYVVPGLVGFAWVLPFCFVVGVIWSYFSLPTGSRSFRAVVANFLPASDFQSTTTKVNLRLTLLQLLIYPLVFGVFGKTLAGIVSFTAVNAFLEHTFGIPETRMIGSAFALPIQIVTLILAGDFGIYVTHVMCHRIPFMWAFHRVHHSAECLTSFPPVRAHPFENLCRAPFYQVINASCVGMAIYWTTGSLSPTAISWVTAAYTAVQWLDALEHSRVRLSYGPLNRIFTSPVAHQIHHSAEARHWDKNFGSVLAIWDWLFGTQYLPSKDETWRFGLGDSEIGTNNPHNTAVNALLEPFRYALWALRGRPGYELGGTAPYHLPSGGNRLCGVLIADRAELPPQPAREQRETRKPTA